MKLGPAIRPADPASASTIQVKEQVIAANIKGLVEAVSSRPVQFASEITGPCTSVEWRFGDGRPAQSVIRSTASSAGIRSSRTTWSVFGPQPFRQSSRIVTA